MQDTIVMRATMLTKKDKRTLKLFSIYFTIWESNWVYVSNWSILHCLRRNLQEIYQKSCRVCKFDPRYNRSNSYFL